MKKGLLKIVSTRPSFFGLEMHLLDLYKIIADFKPTSVVIDPLTSLIGQGNQLEIQSMLTRMIDALKSRGMGHSSDVHKLILSDEGMHLVPMDADATAGPKQKQKGSERVAKTTMNQKRKRI